MIHIIRESPGGFFTAYNEDGKEVCRHSRLASVKEKLGDGFCNLQKGICPDISKVPAYMIDLGIGKNGKPARGVTIYWMRV